MKELTLKELQSLEIEILEDVHEFCINNELRYSLYGGTAIGAVRHSGFIPWDDDIDIVMPRPDYEKFCNSYSSDRFRFIERRNDDNSMLAFARVCDDKRTICKSNLPWHKETNAVWIDIFPADGYDSRDMTLYNECLSLRSESLRARQVFIDYSISYGIIANVKLFIKKILYNKNSAGKIIDRLIEKSMTYKFGECDSWAVLCCPYSKRTIHPIDTFKDVKLVPFEKDSFCLLNGVDRMLTNVYGDYMQLPPPEKRVPPMQASDKFYWK